MKIVLSRAKSLNYTDALPSKNNTIPHLIQQSEKVNDALRDLSAKDLQDLMGISDKLANLNVERNHARNYRLDKISEQVRQAIYAFNGDVYEGIDAYSLSTKNINYLQKNLRIL